MSLDIARCNGKDCHQKDKCKRFIRENERGIFTFANFEEMRVKDECDFYISNNNI